MTLSDKSTCTVIVFTRFPTPGKAKTRLIPLLGPDGSAAFQKQMTEFTLDQVRQSRLPLEIRFTGASEAAMRQWLGPDFVYTPQREGDLGQRMRDAFADAFEAGAKKVILMGSDCPDNRAANLLKAAKALEISSCVIGPALDGGYYLLGLSFPQPHLFQDIAWGSKNVFQQTIAKLKTCHLLPLLSDVDEPRDVPPKISVIIPALNEEKNIDSCLETVVNAFNVEMIVVDGGSSDATMEVARQKGAIVYQGPEGRASQMNLGARKSSGQILLFLHADSLLPLGWDRQVRQIIKQPKVALGHFRFAIHGHFAGRRGVEIGTNLRSSFLKKPYGDQGLFISRKVFEAMGAYPEVPILEDIFLVKRSKKYGKICQASGAIATSDRRWRKHGFLRVTCFNQVLLLVASLGGDLDKLKHLYQKGKNPLLALLKSNSSR